ncbi:class I SAM-dependent methyltransferase [Solilutibacter silvestris]|uniref:class I SAM-dependent methyltransferase n=1 Tax=Solilutibacter silvestris TaxID=1645665 RepID=UPI003D326F16
MIDQAWPDTDLERVPSCPVCGAVERELLHSGLTDRVFGVAPGQWDLWRCEACSSGYLDPRPTPSSVGRAYEAYFTHVAKDHRVVRRVGKLRTLLHDLINGYQNHRYGLALEHAGIAGRWLLPLLPSLRAAADAECRHLPPLPASGGRLLDVGCGDGGFLALARQGGWSVEGIDFDEGGVAAARSRGLSVRLGGIDLFDNSDERFDVITISHVIEHVHDPLETLRCIYRLLKPGGMLWLETPNINSLGAKRFGVDWFGLDPPRHLVLFNRDSLSQALREVGFRSIRQAWRGMSVFDVYAASESVASGHSGMAGSYGGRPPEHAIRAEFMEMFRASSREFLTFLALK